MASSLLVYPMFAMVLLTFAVLLILFRTRVSYVRDGTIHPGYFAAYQSGSEPERSAKMSRHFSNLFEAPTLFYVACLCAMVTDQSSGGIIALAWLYVLFRVVHAYIHIGPNTLQPRIAAYFGSWIVLIALWARIVMGLPEIGLI